MSGPSCPQCGAPDALPIVYGLPAPGSIERGDWDDVAIGGCLVDVDDPTRECRECDHRWQHPDDELEPA